MTEAGRGHVKGHAECLLRPVIGVLRPRYVPQQAGGISQAPMGVRTRICCGKPSVDLAVSRGKTQMPPRHRSASDKQRVEPALAFRQQLVNVPLAQAERREYDPLGLHHRNDPTQDLRRHRHHLEALARDRGDLLQRAPREPRHQPKKVLRVPPREAVGLNHMDRVVRLLHVDTGGARAKPRRRHKTCRSADVAANLPARRAAPLPRRACARRPPARRAGMVRSATSRPCVCGRSGSARARRCHRRDRPRPPLASGIPAITPSAESRPSSSPERIRTARPVRRRTSGRESPTVLGLPDRRRRKRVEAPDSDRAGRAPRNARDAPMRRQHPRHSASRSRRAYDRARRGPSRSATGPARVTARRRPRDEPNWSRCR